MPAELTDRLLKVATPPTASVVTVPPSAPPPPPEPEVRAIVTAEASPVTVLPYWSSTATCTGSGGVNVPPLT